MKTATYQVWGPAVPGAEPTCLEAFATLAEAERFAERRFADRRDVRYHDVTIRLPHGKRVAFAGPVR